MSKARKRGGKRKELSDNTEQRAQRIEVRWTKLSCPQGLPSICGRALSWRLAEPLS